MIKVKRLQMKKSKRNKKTKEMKITYKQSGKPKEEAQNGIERTFDILFEEVAKKP